VVAVGPGKEGVILEELRLRTFEVLRLALCEQVEAQVDVDAEAGAI